MKYLKYIGIIAACAAAPAFAEASDDGDGTRSEVARDKSITVVATGSELAVDQSGQSISVVGADEIASVQGADIIRVLERLPSVTFSRNGGMGGFTGLRVRGANAEQLLVLLDGVRVADVASPGGGYDFGNLTTGGIEKIELLRGSNSVVWGSDAIGGVLAITSSEVEGVEASAEYGARDSFDGQVNAGLSGERYGIAVNGGYTRTDGVSSAASGTEADGFRQWHVGGRSHVDLSAGLTATLDGRYAKGRVDMDGYPAPLYEFGDTPEYQKTRLMSGRAGLGYSSETLSLRTGFALSDTRRSYFDPTYDTAPNYQTKGRSERADLKGTWDPEGPLRLDFGADNEWTSIVTAPNSRNKARQASGHALLGWHADRLDLSAGVRLDDHSRFGSEWTFGGNGSFEVVDGWRVRASYGEGFKTPTLYQLFSDYGNAALVPERSRSYDLGVEKGNRNGDLHIALTAFRRDSRDLIDYVSCFSVSDQLCDDGRYGFYANVGKARAEGIELELGAKVSDRVRAQAVYSYVKAVNRTAGDANKGNDLARRPRHAVTVALDWRTPLRDLALGADIRMLGDSFDNAANTSRLDGYALVTLRASLPVSEGIELFGRVENLTDERYATTAGYGTPGRSAYFGAKARF